MAIDRYSACPCGSGKKLKFCCSDLAGELEQLESMIKGEQFSAAVTEIEKFEKKHPSRACLLAAKVQLLRALGRMEEAVAVVEQFREAFPENPIALAESTINLLAKGEMDEAVIEVYRAIAACSEVFYSQVYESMAKAAEALGRIGRFVPARALLQYMGAVAADDTRPREMLAALYQSRGWPLLTKDDPPFIECDESASWKADFDAAMDSIQKGLWLDGEEKLTRLIESNPSAVAWFNLAIIRGWLGKQDDAANAWKEYAENQTDDSKRAVEAQATAMLADSDPLGDQFESVLATFTISDADELLAAMSISKQTVQVPTPPTAGEQNEVPPKAVFWVLDRAQIENADEATEDNLPRILGQARLFGRQTDREARLEMLGVSPKNVGALEELFDSLAPDQFEGEPETTVLAEVSASRDLFDCPWFPPQGIAPEKMNEIDRTHFEKVLLEQWPETSLGIFDGKCPREMAGDESNKNLLAATIMVLQAWTEMAEREFDFNLLR
jgi:tetratricopeptide (TPR) repeat protein